MNTSFIEKKSGTPIWKILYVEAIACLVASLAAVYIPDLRAMLIYWAGLALGFFVFHLPFLFLKSKDFVPEDEPTNSVCGYYLLFSLIAGTSLGTAIAAKVNLMIS